MSKRLLPLLVALLLAGLAACLAEEAPQPSPAEAYFGKWVNEEYNLVMRYDEESDQIVGRLWEFPGEYVWEFSACIYDAEESRLVMPNYTRYRQVIDWDTMELKEEDWSIGDLAFASLTLGEDGDTLTAADIPHIDQPLTLRRADEDEHFFDE